MGKIVFFDVANTLLNKKEVYSKMQSILEERGYRVSLKQIIERHKVISELIKFPDKTTKDFYLDFNKKFLRLLGIPNNPDLIESIYQGCKGITWSKFEDVDILSELSVPIGIISNWDLSLKEKLETYFPDIKFSWIIGSEELGVCKPNKKIFEKAIELSGAQPENIIYIGDSIELDIEPALEMGIKAYLIDRDKQFNSSNPLILRSLNELKGILL